MSTRFVDQSGETRLVGSLDPSPAEQPPVPFVQDADPGAVGEGALWVDTSTDPPVLKIRNTADDDWAESGGSQPGAAIVRGPFPVAFDDALAFVPLAITAVNDATPSFTVAGNQTAWFPPAATFKIAGSSGNDGTYTVVSSVFGVATVITVVEAIPDSTADGNVTYTTEFTGFDLYTPTIGDVLLDAWPELTTSWDGFGNKADIGTFEGDQGGLANAVTAPWQFDSTADNEGAGNGMLVSSSQPSLVEKNGFAGDTRKTPLRFTAAIPLRIVVTTTGASDGAPTGASAGAANIYLVTATPVAP